MKDAAFKLVFIDAVHDDLYLLGTFDDIFVAMRKMLDVAGRVGMEFDGDTLYTDYEQTYTNGVGKALIGSYAVTLN